jgi:hypothetical protein
MFLGMDLTFEIGEHERHSVHYHFNQSSGFGAISVNGKNVKRFFQMLALSTTFHLKFSVGNEEIHEEISREYGNGSLVASFHRHTV